MRRGFTLSETMVAMLVAGIVLAAIMSTFISAQVMMANTMAESEMALAARNIREKLLFHVAPTIDGVHYSGMLSGTNSGWVVETGSGYVLMQMPAFGNSLSDIRSQSMRLVLGQSGSDSYFVNEHIPNKDNYLGWLWPGRIPLVESSMLDIVSYDTLGAGAEGVYRVHIGVDLAAKGPRNVPVYRRERVSVPLMGRRQPMMDSAGRY
jgi:prepilin-type N-terminal cleavage/methylation domain-containing protein